MFSCFLVSCFFFFFFVCTVAAAAAAWPVAHDQRAEHGVRGQERVEPFGLARQHGAWVGPVDGPCEAAGLGRTTIEPDDLR